MGHAAREVVLRLTRDEALVLFELLHHWEDQDRVTQPEHHAGQIALWNLSCLLERELTEPLDPAYDRLVNEARTRLAGESEDPS
ncbi:MAG: hypothetical protein ABSB59_40065 [Streptosporangiaceae bacterium]|jgi:hypothetical protein